MQYLLMLCLFGFFAYALALVIINNNEVAVNLVFSQVPEMNVGLLLIICISLGVLIGILLALLMFKVLQNKWELMRLKKENSKLNKKLEKVNDELERFKTDADLASIGALPEAEIAPPIEVLEAELTK